MTLADIEQRIDLAYADLARLDERPVPDDVAKGLEEIRQRGRIMGQLDALEWLQIRLAEGGAA